MSAITEAFSRKINKCIGQKGRDLRGYHELYINYRLAEVLEEAKCYNTYELHIQPDSLKL